MGVCPLCSKEVKGKSVICRDCEQKVKQNHPDAMKDKSVNKKGLLIGAVVIVLITVVALILKNLAGNYSTLFQLGGIVLILLVVMHQVVSRI